MTAVCFILLLLTCAVMLGGSLLYKSDPDNRDKDHKTYYTEDGYHVYYDRKLPRRLREEAEKKEEIPPAQEEK